jgi:polar amino acid transport system substrate-binding protein
MLGRHSACALVAGAALTAATLSGCSGSSAHTDARPAPTAAQLVPAAIRSAGTLHVSSDIEYAPNEFFDAQKHAKGLDYDLAAALAKELHLKLSFDNVGWDDLVPKIKAHDEDLIMSSMTDTAQRQKDISFVDYFIAGSQMVVRAGNPAHITSIADLCGHSVAVQADTTHQDIAKAESAHCVSAHRPPVSIVVVDSGKSVAAVESGQAEAAMDDFPVMTYAVSQDHNVELAGAQLEAAPYGIGVARDRTALRDAVQLGLEQMQADGTYGKILKAWDVTSGALRTDTINGGA